MRMSVGSLGGILNIWEGGGMENTWEYAFPKTNAFEDGVVRYAMRITNG